MSPKSPSKTQEYKLPRPRKSPTNRKEELEEELSQTLALKVLNDTEGGQVLLKLLLDDLVSAIESIAASSGTLTHIEFISLGTKIRERLDIARSICRARTNADMLRQVLKQDFPGDPEETDDSEASPA